MSTPAEYKHVRIDQIREALTTKITLRPIPFPAVLLNTIENHPFLTETSKSLHSKALDEIRHNYTNYDDVWQGFGISYPRSEEWQIVYRRTMTIIRDAYPELSEAVDLEINRRLPLTERAIICLPQPLDDVKREVVRLTTETGEAEPVGSRLDELLVAHIRDQQTDYRELHALALEQPAGTRDTLVDEVFTVTTQAVATTYPELRNAVRVALGEPVVESHAETKTLKRSATNRTKKRREVPVKRLNPNLPLPKLDVPQEKKKVTKPRKNAITDQCEIFVKRLPLEEVFEKATFLMNENRMDASPVWTLDGDEVMVSRIRDAVVGYIMTHASNHQILLQAMEAVHPKKRLESRIAHEHEMHEAICYAYPELVEDSERCLEKRLKGSSLRKLRRAASLSII